MSASSSRKNKVKYSKFPSSLIYSFMLAIDSQGYSIRQAAMKYRINYSTAKSLYKKHQKFFVGRKSTDVRSKASQYSISQKQGLITTYRALHEQQSNQENVQKQVQFKRIQVISTVGYQYFKEMEQSEEN